MLFLCLVYNRLVTVRCTIVEYNNHVQFIILSDSGYMRDQMPTNLSNLRSKNIVTDTKRFFINLCMYVCMSFETVKRHFYQPCPILGLFESSMTKLVIVIHVMALSDDSSSSLFF